MKHCVSPTLSTHATLIDTMLGMGDWHNSKEAKELRRARERHHAAGRPPLTIGLVQSERDSVSDALLCKVLNHLFLQRNLARLHIVRDMHNWEQLKAWAKSMGVEVEFYSQHYLAASARTLHGLIALNTPEWVAQRFRAQGVAVWEPVRKRPA